MGRFLYAIIWLCGLSSAQVTIPVVVQVQSHAGVSSSGWPKTPTSGDPFIACWSNDSSGTLTGISDTQSNSFTLITSVTSGGAVTKCWVSTFASSSADTITVTGTFNKLQMAIAEFNKTYVTATIDGTNTGTFSGTPGTVTTSNTTTFYNSVYFAYAFSPSSDNAQFGTSLPLLVTHVLGNQNNSASGYKLAGAPGSITGTFTNLNTAGSWVAFALKPTAMAIYDTVLPNAVLSTAYSFTVQVLNGVAGPTFSISSGALPAGLSLNASTGAITGTPTGGGRTFTIQATDGTTTVTQTYNLIVDNTAGTPSYVSSNGFFSPNIDIGTVALGDIIIVSIREDVGNGVSGHSVIPPTDSCSSVYTYTGGIRVTSANEFQLQYMAPAGAAGACAVTPNASDTFTGAEAIVIRGTQGFFDNTVFTTGTTGTTWTSNSIVTNATNSMIVLAASGSAGTMSAGAGYTLGNGYAQGCTTTCSMQQEYGLQATEGAYAPTITGVSGNWRMATVALRAAASGPVSSSGQYRHKGWIF